MTELLNFVGVWNLVGVWGTQSPPETEAFLADKVVWYKPFLVHILSKHFKSTCNWIPSQACSHSRTIHVQLWNEDNSNFAEDWNLIGGLGTESPRSKSFLVVKVPIRAVLVSFINHIIYQWLVLLSVKKILPSVWGVPWPPVAPWIRHWLENRDGLDSVSLHGNETMALRR